jgi:hypothetical protein
VATAGTGQNAGEINVKAESHTFCPKAVRSGMKLLPAENFRRPFGNCRMSKVINYHYDRFETVSICRFTVIRTESQDDA